LKQRHKVTRKWPFDKLCRLLVDEYLFLFVCSFARCSWLYHETTVQNTTADEEGNIVATVVMDETARKKYQAKFGKLD